MVKKLLLSLALILGIVGSAKASHMMGADMSYICLGGGKYKIIAKVYRDCRGIPFNSPTFGAFAGTNGGNGCGNYSISISRTGIRDITPRCSSASKPCDPSNTTTGKEGVEEHTFETTVDFNSNPLKNFVNNSSCCEVTFYIGQCCRNGAITTGQSNQDFYATCMINICNLKGKCNSSPQLSNEPIAYLCCTQPFYFNNGAIDTSDFDSMSYKLVSGLQSLPNGSVNYKSPLSVKVPMTPYCIPPGTVNCTPNPNTKPPRGFFIDTSSGDLIFTPTDCTEVGIVVIEITEWRKDSASGKWVVIGKTRRDMQLIVLNSCGYNNPPVLSGPQSNQVCEGDKLCFKVDGKDETFVPHQTIPDTVSLKWNRGIPGATFTTLNPKDREKTAEFCWQTRVGQGSDVAYSFTVTATDDHCPKPSTSIKAFRVRVKKRAFSERKYDILKCGRFAFTATPGANFKGSPTYRWSIKDSTNQKEFFYSTKKTDTVTFKFGGKYIITHTVNNADNCPTIYRDTVVIPDPMRVSLAMADTFACFGTQIDLYPNIANGASPYRYYWTRPTTHNAGDTLSSLSIPNINRDSTIILRVRDNDGCFGYDTVTIFLKPLPVVNLGPDQRICTYERVTFDAQHADSTFYNWSPTGDTTRTITVNVAGDYIVTVTDTVWFCKGRDTVHLYVNDTVVALAGKDRVICTKDTLNIIAGHRPSNQSNVVYRWDNVTSGSSLGSSKNYNIRPLNTNNDGGNAQTFTYSLFARVTQGGHACEDYDTMNVKVNTLPIVDWLKNPLDARCYDYGDIVLTPSVTPQTAFVWARTPGMVDSINPTRYVFRTTKLKNSDLQGGKRYTERIYARFKDTNGCINRDSTTQVINGNPVVQLRKRIYCQDKGDASLDSSVVIPKVKNGINFNWRVLEAPGGVDKTSMIENRALFGTPDYWIKFGSVTEDYYAGSYLLEYCVEDQITRCRTCDTVEMDIVTEPKLKVYAPPALCNNWDTIDLLDFVTVNGTRPAVADGSFKVVSFNFERDPNNAPQVNQQMISGHIFDPAFGVGEWEIKYTNISTGCPISDSFVVKVNALPNVSLIPNFTVCSDAAPIDLNSLVVSRNPIGGIDSWSGSRIVGNQFVPGSNGTAILEGPNSLRFTYTDDKGCQDRKTIDIMVRTRPQITITNTKPMSGCERTPFDLISDAKFTNAVVWETILGSDGNIDNPSNFNVKYNHGNQDSANGNAWVRVRTLPIANEVCPQASDSIQMIIHAYPEFTMDSIRTGCVPLTLNFLSNELKGIPAAQLAYNWSFGNGQTSTDKDPLGIQFTNQGYYDVTLTVTNTAGPCAVTRTINSMVTAYPNPVADFTSDPLNTTIALPKFNFINRSTLDKSIFAGDFNRYNWNFGTGLPTDTSTKENPSFAYGKDTNTYTVTLLVTTNRGCTSVATRRVKVGPDIIVYIPDAFTPDAAGVVKNNTFNVFAENFKTFRMTIYNRWGEKMYETNDINKGWDGKANGTDCQQDVYVYHVEITSFEDKLYKFDGTVTLLR